MDLKKGERAIAILVPDSKQHGDARVVPQTAQERGKWWRPWDVAWSRQRA